MLCYVKTPFEFDIGFAVFVPLRVCVWPFGVCIPFWVYIPFWPLWPPISLLTCTCTLYGFSAYVSRVRASPYGIFGRFEDEWSLMGFSCRFADEWSLMGFSYRFVVSDAIWDFQFVSQRWTPFEFWRSFAAFRPLRVCLTVWVFIYLFIYSFIHLFT